MRNPCMFHPETGAPCDHLKEDKDAWECVSCFYRRAYVASLAFGEDVKVEFRDGKAYVGGKRLMLPQTGAISNPTYNHPLRKVEKLCKFPDCKRMVTKHTDYCDYHRYIVAQRKYYKWPEERWHDPVRKYKRFAKGEAR